MLRLNAHHGRTSLTTNGRLLAHGSDITWFWPTCRSSAARLRPLIVYQASWSCSARQGVQHMSNYEQNSVTSLLDALRAGDRDAFEQLFPLVYDELHKLASIQRGRWEGIDTLNTTALVEKRICGSSIRAHRDG